MSKAHWIVGRLLRASKVRGKLDMKDPNKSLRDPVYYRSNPIAHHRIGSGYISLQKTLFLVTCS
jgi:hypothetical protein